jgi:DNA helicase-2/ATP-dependent DNA helicase PcrA
MTDYLSDLTASQREAVLHMEGPLLVLAGAGSGKTRVITCRVAHLLQAGVRPSRILAITFTNKAAGEMRQRIEALVPESRVWISTFHSLGARLLRQFAARLSLDPNFTVYDQDDRYRIIKSALGSAEVDHVRFTPERIQSAISKAKNQLMGPTRYGEKAADFFSQTVARVYPIYEQRLREANAFDFDDLLLWPALALQHDPELRAELDARFQFVLIDEYQDTNMAQYAMIRSLSIDHPNLFVVGDPDQCVYGWRGSDIRNILEFERDFPNAKVITLDRNYRSTKFILRAAGHLIAHNRQRKHKDLITENGTGRPVTVWTMETGVEEAETVAGHIRSVVDSGQRSFRDFAVFVRINALSRALESAFIKHRLPFQIVRGLAFFERKENRDVLAYLRLILNPRDNLAFVRAVNEPARGIGKVTLDRLREYAQVRDMSLLAAAEAAVQIEPIKGRAKTALREFAALIRELQKQTADPPDQLIREVLDRSGYRTVLRDSGDPADQERLANIEELITAARQFAAEDPSRTIADLLENISLASDVDGWDERHNCVSIMTLHAAKGLEFPVVGMTRAKEELYLSRARIREFRGTSQYSIPSMFLDELPEDAVEAIDLTVSANRQAKDDSSWAVHTGAKEPSWRKSELAMRDSPLRTPPDRMTDIGDYHEGMLVRHPTYGPGQVTEVSGFGALTKVKVRFRSEGEKTFVAAKAQLAIVQKA